MDKPAYAGINTLVKEESAIEEAFRNLKRELTAAFKQHLTSIETKLRAVNLENERLHAERLTLSKEIQRRRDQEERILEMFGAKKT